MGDSLLRGSEVPICRPDRESREVCCLLGAKVRDVARGCHNLSRAQTTIHWYRDTNDTSGQNLGRIKEDYKALRVQVESIGVQVIFASILPVRGKGAARNRRLMQINFWLHGWCHCEGFGFYDNKIFFDDNSLLGRDGIHLSRRGNGIFDSRLANLVRRALN